jgi:hypothetical protein
MVDRKALVKDLKNIEWLRIAIRENNLMDYWQDGPFVKTPEEGKAHAKEMAIQARDAFIRMMNSPKNDGSLDYQQWAIAKALGLRTQLNRADGKDFSKRPNRGMN